MSNSTNWRRANTLQQKEQTLYPRTYNPTRKGTKQQNTQRASKEQQQQTGSTKQINRKNKLKLRVWGDSFMGPMALMNNEIVRFNKFKGGSARGLSKESSTLQAAARITRDLDLSLSNEAWCFGFGGVDFHLNYFHKLRLEHPKRIEPEDWVAEVFDRYTSFLEREVVPRAEKRDAKIYVAAVVYPIVIDAYLSECIDAYTAESGAHLKLEHDPVKDIDMNTRRDMVKKFNERINNWCEHRKQFTCIDINQYLCDETGSVKPEFIDQSELNIHPLWEPAIPFWITLLQGCGLGLDDLQEDLSQTAGKYEQEKKIEMLDREPLIGRMGFTLDDPREDSTS